jgi:alpha-tubulin suppressor-like RCC1 family protein
MSYHELNLFGEYGTGYKMFVRGKNDDGQLGISQPRDNVPEWQQLDLSFTKNAPIKFVACGYYHTLLLTGIPWFFTLVN